MGYVGKTSKKRKDRDEQHKKSVGIAFDEELYKDKVNQYQNWEVVTVCRYDNEVMGFLCWNSFKKNHADRLEPLFIILFNTSSMRKNKMGFNSSAGGSWGASVVH